MFSKKPKTPPVDLKAGWTSELIEAIRRYSGDRGLGMPSNDFTILIDALVIESNNFEVERRGYGHVELIVGPERTNTKVPVVVSFILDEDLKSWFHARLEDPEIATIAGSDRVYGKAVLNGRISRDGNREICTPGFERNLYITETEWSVYSEAAQLAEKSYILRFGVRVGLPDSVTEETIVNDSMNTRVLIHRV